MTVILVGVELTVMIILIVIITIIIVVVIVVIVVQLWSLAHLAKIMSSLPAKHIAVVEHDLVIQQTWHERQTMGKRQVEHEWRSGLRRPRHEIWDVDVVVNCSQCWMGWPSIGWSHTRLRRSSWGRWRSSRSGWRSSGGSGSGGGGRSGGSGSGGGGGWSGLSLRLESGGSSETTLVWIKSDAIWGVRTIIECPTCST